jgi:hypothetical protein
MSTYLRCPFKPPKKYGTKTFPFNCEVQIMVGICAEASLCKNTICPFYDVSKEADEVFARALIYPNTEEGIGNPRVEGIDEAIYKLLLDTCGRKEIFDLTGD